MDTNRNHAMLAVALIVAAGLLILYPRLAVAHCDTLDGPVIAEANAALEKGDVTSVLKWVKEDDEREIRQAFEKTMAVRTKAPEARELADTYFFETLVRVHRAGEGAPYSGLKGSGAEMGPAVTGADKALETGKIDSLVKLVNDSAAAGIRERFHRAIEAKKHANESVEAGREYVEAYVEFVHYVERLHGDAAGPVAHHAEINHLSVESGHHR
ncbi:hypothetical protein HZA56_06515 [Candidatus Poribacteria bacterium]|nr:hypothetical protein [Candidatus Poribacteria bacterium]